MKTFQKWEVTFLCIIIFKTSDFKSFVLVTEEGDSIEQVSLFEVS